MVQWNLQRTGKFSDVVHIWIARGKESYHGLAQSRCTGNRRPPGFLPAYASVLPDLGQVPEPRFS